MERVALLRALDILNIDPQSEVVESIKSLVYVVAKLLHDDTLFVNIPDHEYLHVLFGCYLSASPKMPNTMKQDLKS